MRLPIEQAATAITGITLAEFAEADAAELFAVLDHDPVWAYIPGPRRRSPPVRSGSNCAPTNAITVRLRRPGSHRA